MAYYLSPIFQDAQLGSTGAALVGGQLETYDAGTSTPRTVYQDNDGSASHTNPIILNARGEPPAAIWMQGGYPVKFVLKDAAGATIRTIDDVAGVNEVASTSTASEWSASGLTPTYVSGTSFTVSGNQTATLHPGRRVKTTNTAGTRYGVIASSAYTSLTTVTVVNDSGTLDSGLSVLSVSILSADNSAVPVVPDNQFAVSGSSDSTKKIRFEVDGLTTSTTRVITAPDYDLTLGNIPAGVIMDYAGTATPTGWLPCDGAAVSRTTYSALFSAISTTWGAGDTSTTFNVPDLRGRTTLGSGTGTATASGTNADVDTSNDTLTVASNDDKWVTGMAVVFTLASGTISGLSSSSTYYVVRASSTTVKLASSLANAQNGTVIDMTAKSSPVWTITHTLTARTTGGIGGEQSHAMSSTELLAHTHTSLELDGTGLNRANSGTGVFGDETTTSTGGNAAMNVMPPYAVVTKIIKY